ncbi:MAG: hypothetical protein ACYCYF_13280, partial [Anaerolineae bacterium]
MALAFMLAEGFQLEAGRLVRFLLAYQDERPLDTGELWALPVMLRFIALQRIVLAAGRLSGSLAEVELPESFAPLRASAASDLAPRASTDEVAMAHAIPSLRLIDELDWSEMFEKTSLVHRALCDDPVGIYPRQDFETRDRYRQVIEELARSGELGEVAVAELAVELSRRSLPASTPREGYPAHSPPAHDGRPGEGAEGVGGRPWAKQLGPAVDLSALRSAHIGYYLVDEGRALLAKRIGYRPPLVERLRAWLLGHATANYFASIVAVTLATLALTTGYGLLVGVGTIELLAIWLMVAVPALTAGVRFTNWWLTRVLPPRILPKLDLRSGTPPELRTALVVPSLIASTDDIDHLIAQLEQHYLLNPDPELVYALLTDFTDADVEVAPHDASLLEHAARGIEALNARVAHAPFYLLHRRRLWNGAQGKWIGWERKRGKLHEFNRLIRGATDTTFAWRLGDMARLGEIRFVITLDADTILPREGAARLIGTLAHPLNQAQFDERTGRVTAGYTVLQPRPEIRPVSATRSLFTRVFAGDNGLDLYTRAVSDAYQDLFGAGIYVGKGIYDVDRFERSVAG